MAELIVADASPLIILGRIDHLHLLAPVGGKVIVPDVVRAECVADPARPGAQAIERAFAMGQLSVQPDFPKFQPISFDGLDPGEEAAIGLAMVLNCYILIDERLGRTVAKSKGLTVVGTLGILLKAKQVGLIPAVAPLISALRGQSFYLSEELERQLLLLAGE